MFKSKTSPRWLSAGESVCFQAPLTPTKVCVFAELIRVSLSDRLLRVSLVPLSFSLSLSDAAALMLVWSLTMWGQRPPSSIDPPGEAAFSPRAPLQKRQSRSIVRRLDRWCVCVRASRLSSSSSDN